MNLQERLEQVTAARKIRYATSQYILANDHLFFQLLQFCFSSQQKLAAKACWVFEFVCQENPTLLFPHFDYFIENLKYVKFDSAKRPLCRILSLFCHEASKFEDFNNLFTINNRQAITEICFDWLINNEKVALKCYSMRILEFLGRDNEWIHPELQLILEQNIHLHSAAYKAAAKDVLKKISL